MGTELQYNEDDKSMNFNTLNDTELYSYEQIKW